MFIAYNKMSEKSLLTKKIRFWRTLGTVDKVKENMGCSLVWLLYYNRLYQLLGRTFPQAETTPGLPFDKYSQIDPVKIFANQA